MREKQIESANTKYQGTIISQTNSQRMSSQLNMGTSLFYDNCKSKKRKKGLKPNNFLSLLQTHLVFVSCVLYFISRYDDRKDKKTFLLRECTCVIFSSSFTPRIFVCVSHAMHNGILCVIGGKYRTRRSYRSIVKCQLCSDDIWRKRELCTTKNKVLREKGKGIRKDKLWPFRVHWKHAGI